MATIGSPDRAYRIQQLAYHHTA